MSMNDDIVIKIPLLSEEVRKIGKWIPCNTIPWWRGGGYWRCSICNRKYSYQQYPYAEDWEYCPHCGASMRRSEK